ncbi:MAG: serine hydrolase, partial [Ekhidna sp.]|nr:serine hydrolase [Ekhidna sp.]
MVSISSRLFFSLLLIGTLLIPIKTIGQTTGIQEAESFLSTKSLKIPNGAQIAVALVSDTTFQTFGLRSENNQIISTLNDSVLFEIGSITKVMTAMLLMDFIIKDSISLHEKIEPYLPADFPKNDLQHVGSISFQELATHQSGLHRDPLKTKQYIRL